MMRSLSVLAFLLLFGSNGPAYAVKPGEQLPDPAQEARARSLSAELRCLVCQNQSIDDSDAALAMDLRRIVRERIAAGESDQGVRDYLVARYGEFVLLKPSFSTQTLLLWTIPGLALLLGGFAASRLFRRQVSSGSANLPDADEGAPASTLTEAEQHELERLVGTGSNEARSNKEA